MIQINVVREETVRLQIVQSVQQGDGQRKTQIAKTVQMDILLIRQKVTNVKCVQMAKCLIRVIKHVKHVQLENTKRVMNANHVHEANLLRPRNKRPVKIVLSSVQNPRQRMKRNKPAMPIAAPVLTIGLLNQTVRVGIVVRVNLLNHTNVKHVQRDIFQTIITKRLVQYVHLVRQH